PEVLRGQSYTLANDIYSFSMIMWEFIYGIPPFDNKTHDFLLALHICKYKRPKIIKNISQCYINLMKKCWDMDFLISQSEYFNENLTAVRPGDLVKIILPSPETFESILEYLYIGDDDKLYDYITPDNYQDICNNIDFLGLGSQIMMMLRFLTVNVAYIRVIILSEACVNRFTIDDRYTPGTRHAVNVALKSDPSIFCTGTPCTVTADGGAPVQQVPRQKRAFLSIITYNK
ncbi:3047_t:CDS:2, partial [Funneliformis geosporum]